MQHDEFIGQVQHRAHLSSRGEAEFATRAVLETLAERLAGGEADDVAAQLPKGLAAYLQHDRSGMGARYSLHDFFNIVSQREGVDLSHAAHHAHAVIEVLTEAISPGEVEDIEAQMPPDLRSLFAGIQEHRRVQAGN